MVEEQTTTMQKIYDAYRFLIANSENEALKAKLQDMGKEHLLLKTSALQSSAENAYNNRKKELEEKLKTIKQPSKVVLQKTETVKEVTKGFEEVISKMSDNEDLMAKSLTYLLEAMEIAGKMTVKVKDLSELDFKVLEKERPFLEQILFKMGEAQDYWIASATKGTTAMQGDIGSSDGIDVKLFLKRKLDLDQMTRVMFRQFCGYTALRGLNTIQSYIDGYRFFSEKSKNPNYITDSLVAEGIIKLLRDTITVEIQELDSRLRNVDIFNQNLMITKAAKIANVSLIVSFVALIIALLQLLR